MLKRFSVKRATFRTDQYIGGGEEEVLVEVEFHEPPPPIPEQVVADHEKEIEEILARLPSDLQGMIRAERQRKLLYMSST